MDDEKLDGALGALRERLAGMTPGRPVTAAGCMTFGQARELALDPARITAQVRTHLEACRRCRTLLTSFVRDLPHLPYWTLLRRLLGLLSPREQQRVHYHLESGGCRECWARYDRLAASPVSTLLLPAPHLPPHPTAARAAVPEPEVLVRGVGENLEAELVLDRDHLSLEIRTRAPELRHSLVAYAFQDAAGESLLDGYSVLGPDVEGWYAAEIPLELHRFREEVFKPCERMALAVVLPESLSDEEWAAVESAAPPPEAETHHRLAWRTWANRTVLSGANLSEAARGVLSRIAESRS